MPVSYVFHNIRLRRDLRHACYVLPRRWWHAYADEFGYCREWSCGAPQVRRHRTFRLEAPYWVSEVYEKPLIASVIAHVGVRCTICEEHVSYLPPKHHERCFMADAEGETLCIRCMNRARKYQSFLGAQAAHLGKLARKAAKAEAR